MRPKSTVQCPTSALEKEAVKSRGLNELPNPEDFGVWTSDPGLKVSDLRKAFVSPTGERIDVLRGVDFSAAPGEILAITGASGSGKSTLLQLLGGLDEADHGTILLNQFAINGARNQKLARFRQANIGFIFQFHHLLSDLTASENVSLPLRIARASSRDVLSRANRALESVSLGEKGDYPVGHLSGGEQQRVAVARALINEPALVLADEPTGNLDSTIGEEIAAVLLNYSRSRQAIVIVATHNLRLAQICDRILTIRDCRLGPQLR